MEKIGSIKHKQNERIYTWLIALMALLIFVNRALAQSTKPNHTKSTIENNINNSISFIKIIDHWNESSKNEEYRKNDGLGFLYEYNLPDAQGISYALFRTYKGNMNNGYIRLDISKFSNTLISLNGRYKFSGSDIDQAKDTLIIAISKYNKESNSELKRFDDGQITENDFYEMYSDPQAQFQNFHINLNNLYIRDNEFLAIQFIIKSGSDDSFYYGTSNAVIDNLRICFKHLN
ncbi:hypothetical protein DHD32_20190 [Arenibacter sp. TNZ]|uniref:hypothetical protein n=1 Tax=Arenibacter TaxID=178469 RepID=UPI000CD407BB|nr:MULTISPECIES: hypothetical protein [Arenibacter]MCM4173798.1 hypothetical protein [Arenibacter sp. TNZ]